jgi:single-strand DNA-binding protein
MNLNKVFILGRVTADPQLRSTTGGSQVSSFSIATNRVWNDKSGSKKEEVEFHNVVAWGRQAEVASRFLTKGALVLVEGRLQTRDWEGKDGQKRKTTEIICERLQLGPKPAGSRQMKSGGESVGDNSKNNDLPTIDVADEEINSEDLPF